VAGPGEIDAARAAARRSRSGGRLAIAIGLAGVAAAAFYALRDDRAAARSVTITAGYAGTTRALVAQALADELIVHGMEATVIAEGSSDHEVESLRSGEVDFALVSAVHRSAHRDPGVRIAAALHMEALHLLVRPELAARASEGLDVLRGRTVDLGPDGSAGSELAAQLCEFAGIPEASAAAPDGYRPVSVGIDLLLADLDGGDPAVLPDAIFHLASMPSLLAQRLVREAGYGLVPLPFAEPFRMQAILTEDATPGGPHEGGVRRLVTETSIPPFLYRTRPAVPAEPLPTLGARLLLLTHERVANATIERVLGAIYETRLTRLLHPTLDHSVLSGTPRRELHPGTIDYLAQREPAITGEVVSDASNTLSVLATLLGGGLFLVQGWRQRQRARREQVATEYLLRVAAVERRVVENELATTLDLDVLIGLQRELLTLQSEVLDRFTNGALDDPSLAGLLDSINASREHLGDLLLHVRSDLEEQARREGRTSSAVWSEAAAEAADGGK
jgi:TRAP-type uncharacterized transport system substrate-binding protein